MVRIECYDEDYETDEALVMDRAVALAPCRTATELLHAQTR